MKENNYFQEKFMESRRISGIWQALQTLGANVLKLHKLNDY